MRYLTLEEILKIHFQVIQDYGGSHGVRKEDRLESVVSAPQQFIFGKEQYSSVTEKAAVYLRNIIGDHPFTDGNKRTGVTVAGIFMTLNGLCLTVTPKELEDFAVKVATECLNIEQIACWLEDHTKKV